MFADTDTGMPRRFQDRHLDVVQEWQGGCLLCDSTEVAERLPRSDGSFYLPLCRRHIRWAMASRRERVGRQARHLKRYLLAWCRLRGGDADAAKDWLGY